MKQWMKFIPRINGINAALLLSGAALILNGCVTFGYPFASQHVAGIEMGKTTQADIRKMFGEPFRTGIEDGKPTWTYLHYYLSMFKQPKTKDLYIQFGSDGTVKSYSFSTNIGADEMNKNK